MKGVSQETIPRRRLQTETHSHARLSDLGSAGFSLVEQGVTGDKSKVTKTLETSTVLPVSPNFPRTGRPRPSIEQGRASGSRGWLSRLRIGERRDVGAPSAMTLVRSLGSVPLRALGANLEGKGVASPQRLTATLERDRLAF